MTGGEQRQIQGNGGNGCSGEEVHQRRLMIDLNDDEHQADLLRYAVMVDAAYKTFDEVKKHPGESYETVLSSRLATNAGYVVTAHLYATVEPLDLPPFAVDLLPAAITGLNKPYWFGYIAVAVGAGKQQRDDCWDDIVVVLRGSATVADLMMDIHVERVPFPAGGEVAEGFHKVYSSNDAGKEHGELSVQQQIVEEVKRLAKHLRRKQQQPGKLIRVTVTGHSLGGALALMAAHDAAVALDLDEDQPFGVRAVTFGAPRVGDDAFRGALAARGVQVFRVVVKQDIVPKLPANNVLDGDYNIELDDHDASKSPRELIKAHSLDMYMHLILMTLPNTDYYSTMFKINETSTDQAPPPPPPEADGEADDKPKWIKMRDGNGDGFMRLPDSDLDDALL